MKATHTGHCQVCGASQKLPNGVLSIHGYSVKWNMFVGACHGQRHLPFEQSCDLIKGAIERATTQRDQLIVLAAAARAETVNVWEHEYQPATWQNRHSHYVWRLLTPAEFKIECGCLVYTNSKNNRQVRMSFSSIADCNEHRAKAYESEAAAMYRYIQWQTERVQNWKPAPLTSIAKAVA